MNTFHDLFRNSLQTGAVASVTTTLATAACGHTEIDNAAAPFNAVSHIVWGEQAAGANDLSTKYTLTGLALNSAAVTSWAAVHELFFGRHVDRGDIVGSLLGGVAVAGLAYVTDYYIVPRRLTPGFEKRLSDRSLFGIYTTLALSLGLGRLCFGTRSMTVPQGEK